MASEGAFRVGFAEVCITPPVGLWLCGFAARTHPAVGVHDDLYARAMAFESNGGTVVVVSADLIGLDFGAVADIGSRVEHELGIPESRLLLCATHTHSGPALVLTESMGPVDETYREGLCSRIFTAVSEAVRDLRPARILAGRGGPVGIGTNRRETSFGPQELTGDPGGTHADHVDVLKILRDDGSMGLLFSHATHPVTLGPDNYLFSADYCGYAVDALRRIYGPESFAMFVNGCCGNINSARVGTDFEQARRLGTMLAGAAARAAELAWPLEEKGVGGAARRLKLPVVKPAPLGQAEAAAQEHEEALSAAVETSADEHELMQRRHMAGIAQQLVEVVKAGPPWPGCVFNVGALRVGEIAMVGLSAEVFVEYQIALDASSPFERTLVFGTTNGVLGYLPTAAAYEEGGYEVETAHRYYNQPLMIGPESERLVLDAAQGLLSKLRAVR